MGMYSLIEDARTKAMEAANCWHETPEAQALLEKIDAFERASDRWAGELPEAARAFAEGASDAEGELDDLRRDAIDTAADTYSSDRRSDEWLDAWDAADSDAPSVLQVVGQARRRGAGDGYLERFAA
jgi:hypothetical protein